MENRASSVNPKIESSWKDALANEFNADYFAEMKKFLLNELSRYTIYPPGKNIFTAFNLTPVEKVKAVILGQDPYHGPGQAHGLCFSVPDRIKPPPSLLNIFKELEHDLNIAKPKTGNLTFWAKQGVLLLNATLTVRKDQPGSHQGIGWETFTDASIKYLSENRDNLVFMLWGNQAQKKAIMINNNNHLILKAAHPSPLSAHRGFFGCQHFSKTNRYLQQNGIKPINWNLT